MRRAILVVTAFAAVVSASPAVAGTTYKFRVSCSDRATVAQWNTGDIDPGKEYLRVTTGTNNPGCSISDFEPDRDQHLPVDVYEGGVGVVRGIPLVGEILKNLFGW